MKIENLKYEYNSDVVGYVVEDTETNKSINFQFEKVFSNNPNSAFALKCECEGDETYKNFSKEDRVLISEWLLSHEDVLTRENEFTDHFYNHENENPWDSCSHDDCFFN